MAHTLALIYVRAVHVDKNQFVVRTNHAARFAVIALDHRTRVAEFFEQNVEVSAAPNFAPLLRCCSMTTKFDCIVSGTARSVESLPIFRFPLVAVIGATRIPIAIVSNVFIVEFDANLRIGITILMLEAPIYVDGFGRGHVECQSHRRGAFGHPTWTFQSGEVDPNAH